jgi:hypothetical protein
MKNSPWHLSAFAVNLANMPLDPLEDDIPDPPEEELEMAAEEILGHATPGNPAERIEALKKRIAYLQNQLRELDDAGGASKVAQDLTEARRQLAEFQRLDQGRN